MEEFRLVELLNPKIFHTYENNFPIEAFLTLDAYKNMWDLNGLKCELKPVYAADFAMQTLNIQEVAEIIREFEQSFGRWNQMTTFDSEHTRHISTALKFCIQTYKYVSVPK